jgi:hypothetical protein
VDETVDFLGATILERLRRPLFDWCGARREVSGSSTSGTMGHRLHAKFLDTTGSL